MTSRDYSDPEYKKARQYVLRRDKRKCQMPHCDSRKRLNVHHVVPWSKAYRLRHDTRNMITLCRQCHDSIKNREHIYTSMFYRIIDENENNSRH